MFLSFQRNKDHFFSNFLQLLGQHVAYLKIFIPLIFVLKIAWAASGVQIAAVIHITKCNSLKIEENKIS